MSLSLCMQNHYDIPKMRKALQWFAKQDELTLYEVIQHKNALLKDSSCEPLDELLMFVQAIHRCGYGDELAFKTSKSLTPQSAKAISSRRKARAGTYKAHPQKVSEWIAKNLGKIADLRRAGLSWRSISLAIAEEHHITISHSTLIKHWKAAHHVQQLF